MHGRGMPQGMGCDVLVGQRRAGFRCGLLYRVIRAWTASRDIAVPRLVTNSGPPSLPGCLASHALSAATAWASSGVHRSFRPLPVQRTCAPVPRWTSARVSPVSSETRSPARTAVSRRAWSRRPVQVSRSGAASRASASSSVSQVTIVLSVRLGRDGQDPCDDGGVLGVAQRGVAEQGVDRGQPGVAGPAGVAALVSSWRRKRLISRGVEVGEVEVGRPGAGLRRWAKASSSRKVSPIDRTWG